MNFFVLTLFILYCKVLCSNGSDYLNFSEIERNEGVEYNTYTKDNPNDSVDIRDVAFNDDYTSVFIIHGFNAQSLDEPLQVKDDLFAYDDNVERVIVINWQDYSKNAYEDVARNRVPTLAKDLYEKIKHIRKNGAQQIELIGHSVGAHIAGQTGKLLGRDKVDQIYGLDPTSRFFAYKPDIALGADDALVVLVFHTNFNFYGFGSEIGTNDIKVNGGERQPQCQINVDLCSHNAAWTAYSDFLKKVNVDTNEQIHPYVICLDVSGSMVENQRLTRAEYSARNVISNLKIGSFIGIVTFNHEPEIVHKIIEIKDDLDKNSLLSSLPTEAGGSTSIGAGLRLSMNMLKEINNMTQFCSTIVLISDGEQMVGEEPKSVLKDLENECIKVNSIALGKYASKDLEILSNSTKGSVSFASEDGTGQDLVGAMKAFLYMFKDEIDTDYKIYLPSREVSFTGGEIEVNYIIDDDVGKNTEFKYMSYEKDEFDVKLMSPEGQVLTSANSEYFFDDFAKGFRIAYAVPGSWKFIATKTSRRKRSVRSTVSATAVGNTQQLHTQVAPIRLSADVSHRVLEYPRPITISAELRKGEFPVIQAEVFADIKAPNNPLIRLDLQDNGIFPDILANDGIYTTDVKKLPKTERYSVTVTARSNGTAMLVEKKIDYFLKDVVDCKITPCQKLKEFEREADVGSIKLSSKKNENQIPPRKVDDLRGKIENEKEKLISLTWTSPNDEFYNIKIKHYDIRVLINGTNFKNGIKFNASNVVEGSLEADTLAPTEAENIVIKIPEDIWNYAVEKVRSKHGQLKFALKSVGLNGETSERSNIASVVIKEEPIVAKEEPVVIKDPVVIKEEPVIIKEDPVVIKEEPIITNLVTPAKENAVDMTIFVKNEKKECKTILYKHPIGDFRIKFC